MGEPSDKSRQISLAAELSTRYAPPPCPQGNTVERERRRVRLGGQQRLALSLLGGGLLTLLALALVLQPARTGYGTHQQLGLPPCTFLVLFGLRCPSCGMTTSWAHLVRGQLAAATEVNAGGTLLGLLAMMTRPWAVISAVRGSYLGGQPSHRALLLVTLVVVVVTLAHWFWRLAVA